MRKILRALFTGCIGVYTAVLAGPAAATETDLFEEIPVVLTPAKKLQPITRSPASTHIITQDDIKESGSMHLWDALREVPGMDVSTSTIGQPDVSIRGFNDILSNKILLMVDGRSLYLPAQGLQFWQLMPVQPDEIDRIEVVKGPVASLYGANANLGLINIITKHPDQMQGVTASATGGSNRAGLYSTVYGARQGNLSYKVSSGYQEAGGFQARGRDALESARGNMVLSYKLGDDSELSVSSGIARADFSLLQDTSEIERLWFYGPVKERRAYAQSDYRRGGFQARVYGVREYGIGETALYRSTAKLDVLNGETSYAFNPADRHSCVAGGGIRFNRVYSSRLFSEIEESTKSETIWNLFLQDEYKLCERWTLVGSGRLDRYTVSGNNLSGRLAALYFPSDKHLLRFSAGNSFRSPTITEYFMNFAVPLAPPFDQTTVGTDAITPEQYLTYEADYEGRFLNNRLRPFVNIFLTRIWDFIDSYTTGGGILGLDSSFKNAGKASSSGAEIGAEYDVRKGFTLLANYAFNNVEMDDTARIFFSPKHKINAGLRWRAPGDKLTIRLLGHYVSTTESDFHGGGKVPQYVMVNLWAGYQITKAAEFGISGYNILHDTHIESPRGDLIDTRVMGTVRVKF